MSISSSTYAETGLCSVESRQVERARIDLVERSNLRHEVRCDRHGTFWDP